MPLYEYDCNDCGENFDLMRKLSDTSPVKCEKCESENVKKRFNVSSFKLIGKGFYANDYQNKGREKKRKTGK